jgi:hypothetical protein
VDTIHIFQIKSWKIMHRVHLITQRLPEPEADMDHSALRRNVFDRARELEFDCYYSSKGHYKAAARWEGVGMWLGLVAVLSSSAAGVVAPKNAYVASLLSFSVAALTAVLTFTKASERASLHRSSGVKYASMRDRLKVFYTMTCISDVPDDVLLSRLDGFIGEKQETSTESPHIPHWAYKMTLKERPKEDFRKGQPSWNAVLREENN